MLNHKPEPLLVHKSEKVQLVTRLSVYIRHCAHYWKHSTVSGKNRKFDYIDACMRLVYDLQRMPDMYSVCTEINHSRCALREILPQGSSLKSQETFLVNLINDCRKRLHLPEWKQKECKN